MSRFYILSGVKWVKLREQSNSIHQNVTNYIDISINQWHICHISHTYSEQQCPWLTVNRNNQKLVLLNVSIHVDKCFRLTVKNVNQEHYCNVNVTHRFNLIKFKYLYILSQRYTRRKDNLPQIRFQLGHTLL